MSAVQPSRASRRTPAPHIKLTKYDVVVSWLITTATCAGLAFMVMVFIWLSNMLPAPVSKQVTMIPAGDGGYEDGDPNATPSVESPEDAAMDPSVTNEETDVTQLEEVTEQVMEVADNAAVMVAPNEFTDKNSGGLPGSADGTGGRPLGSGGPGRGGAKREQRWFVEFADKGDLKSYAAQLDFFKVELGALIASDGRLVYLSSLSQEKPTTREILKTDGDAEKRLFMNWGAGSEDRRQADVELFQKAGINASDAAIMHFYASETEEMMARIEQSFAGRQASEIRRTYFRVRKAGNGFEFYVHNQLLR